MFTLMRTCILSKFVASQVIRSRFVLCISRNCYIFAIVIFFAIVRVVPLCGYPATETYIRAYGILKYYDANDGKVDVVANLDLGRPFRVEFHLYQWEKGESFYSALRLEETLHKVNELHKKIYCS